MTSQSGTLYKIIVTSCVLLGVNQLSLSSGSAVTASNGVVPTSLSHVQFNRQYPPTGSGLYFRTGDIAAAESGSFFGDGAIASHPLHGLLSGASMDLLNTGAGGNQYVRALVPPQPLDDLQTAGQSYFIEPPTPTTTTIKPTFKKRKTRRPISSLAEKSKKQKAAELDNTPNNEVFQGNHVPFNPFRQIVNTSFGRKRPSDSKQERPRGRAKSVHQETGSVVDTNNNEEKRIDDLNEIQKPEGEPRVLGRRRPASDVRPIRPTTPAADDDSSNANTTDEPLKGRRFPLRRARPNFDTPPPSTDDNTENADLKPARPRSFAKRPRPRPTTTIAAPGTETDNPTETTDPITASRPLTTQTAHTLPVTDARPRVRPARPLGVSRFANNVRFAATTTPSSKDSDDETAPSLPPSPSPRRRPLRPTTRQQSLTTSTEAPEDTLGNHVTDAPPAPVPSRGRGEGPKTSLREGRQGFVLRPRPTPNTEAPTNVESQEEHQEQEVGIRKPLSNRRRKRPTTTVAAPASPAVSYNQEFTGGIVENNVIPPSGTGERGNHGRRTVLRTRPTPLPAIPATGGPPAYQVQEEQPLSQPAIRGHTQFGNPTGGEFLRQTPIGAPSRLRRPTGPLTQSPSPIHHVYDNNPGLIDPNNFVNPNSHFFQLPSQESFFSGGLDNVLGVPSNANFRSLQQQLPGANDFSSRATITADDPEIGHSDYSPAASTEKQSVSQTGGDAEIADAPPSDGDQENKEAEEGKKTLPPAKLSPLERLQQNRQASARKFLSPRKPTEKTTAAPVTPNKNVAKSFRKSLIPPRMLRPRGKLPAAQEEKPVPNDGSENDSGAAEEKSTKNEGTAPEIINDSASSAAETDKDSNAIPISPDPKDEVKETTTTRKPSILEAAKRRRASSALSRNPGVVSTSASAPQPQQQKLKVTPAPPPANHEPESSAAPACEDGQRYSKFLKKCITMYKPKAQG